MSYPSYGPDQLARGRRCLIEVRGDRHHVVHRRVSSRSRQTILFEQTHSRLLSDAPPLHGKVIPYWLSLAGVDELGRIDVDAIESPTRVRGRSPKHLGEAIRMILGGKSGILGAQRPNGVEESVLGLRRKIHQQSFSTPCCRP